MLKNLQIRDASYNCTVLKSGFQDSRVQLEQSGIVYMIFELKKFMPGHSLFPDLISSILTMLLIDGCSSALPQAAFVISFKQKCENHKYYHDGPYNFP